MKLIWCPYVNGTDLARRTNKFKYKLNWKSQKSFCHFDIVIVNNRTIRNEWRLHDSRPVSGATTVAGFDGIDHGGRGGLFRDFWAFRLPLTVAVLLRHGGYWHMAMPSQRLTAVTGRFFRQNPLVILHDWFACRHIKRKSSTFQWIISQIAFEKWSQCPTFVVCLAAGFSTKFSFSKETRVFSAWFGVCDDVSRKERKTGSSETEFNWIWNSHRAWPSFVRMASMSPFELSRESRENIKWIVTPPSSYYGTHLLFEIS